MRSPSASSFNGKNRRSLTKKISHAILKAGMSMIKYIQGIYRSGRIELEHPPEGIVEARVVVAFLPDSNGREPSPQEMEAAADLPMRGVTVTVSPEVAKELYESRGKPHPFRPRDPFEELWLKALAEAAEGKGMDDE
jgi:hypothetical protein